MQITEMRVGEIDGLRGIAILSVLILHWVVLPFIPFFAKIGLSDTLHLFGIGVDLFFVISGFLIGLILLKMEGRKGILTFYSRRILRIWPLYYLLLLVYFALMDKHGFSGVPHWSFPFFIFNYWESFGKEIHPALGTLWSLAIEEQFYIAGPIVFSIFNRKQISIMLIAYLILIPFIRLALAYNTGIDLWKFTPTRLDGICVGLLLSIFLSSERNVRFSLERIRGLSTLTTLLLILLIPAANFLPNELWAAFGSSLVAAAFGCLVLLVRLRSGSGLRSRLLDWGALRYLGLRCYSIYLFHVLFPLITVALFDNFLLGIVPGAALTLLFAHLSWKYIEAPLIRLGRKFSYY